MGSRKVLYVLATLFLAMALYMGVAVGKYYGDPNYTKVVVGVFIGAILVTAVGAAFAESVGYGTVADQGRLKQKRYTLWGQCAHPTEGNLVFISSVGDSQVFAFHVKSKIPIEEREHFFVMREDNGDLKFVPAKAAS